MEWVLTEINMCIVIFYIIMPWWVKHFKCIWCLGFPEGAGKKNKQCPGSEALCKGADRRQSWWLFLGQSSNARAKYSLGDSLCPISIQANATGTSSSAGRGVLLMLRVLWEAVKTSCSLVAKILISLSLNVIQFNSDILIFLLMHCLPFLYPFSTAHK